MAWKVGRNPGNWTEDGMENPGALFGVYEGEEGAMSQTMIELYNKCIENLQNVVSARVIASANIYGIKLFEIRLEGENRQYLGTINIQLETLKRMNVASRLNSFKKVQAWLDTDEGKNYVVNAMKRKYERDRAKYETK